MGRLCVILVVLVSFQKEEPDFQFVKDDYERETDDDAWAIEDERPGDTIDESIKQDDDTGTENPANNLKEDEELEQDKIDDREIFRRFEERREESRKKRFPDQKNAEGKADVESMREKEKEKQEEEKEGEEEVMKIIESIIDNLEEEPSNASKVQKSKQDIADDFRHKVVEKYVDEADAVFGDPVEETHERLPPLVTAASKDLFNSVLQLVNSIQTLLPNEKLVVFDLDLEPEQKEELSFACNVEVRPFFPEIFPEHVRDLKDYHWRALIIQMMLAQNGHVIWINPSVRLMNKDLIELYHKSEEHGALLVAHKMGFSTYAVTHEDMFLYLETDIPAIKKSPHFSIKMLVLHNTDSLQAHVMKWLIHCIVEKGCIAPANATWKCNYDFTYKDHALCHMYDESAMNILFKNWFHFDHKYFIVENTWTFDNLVYRKVKLKTCGQKRRVPDRKRPNSNMKTEATTDVLEDSTTDLFGSKCSGVDILEKAYTLSRIDRVKGHKIKKPVKGQLPNRNRPLSPPLGIQANSKNLHPGN